MTVTIHPTLPAEAELLATIQKAAFKPLYDRYRDEGNPYLRGPEDILCRLDRNYRQYTIECDGETVGGILYRLHGKRRPFDPLTEGEYYLGRVYVHPLYQNKGIAAEAIRLCEQEFPDATAYYVDFPADMDKNRRCYEKVGFTDTGMETRTPGEPVIALYKKTVNPSNAKECVRHPQVFALEASDLPAALPLIRESFATAAQKQQITVSAHIDPLPFQFCHSHAGIRCVLQGKDAGTALVQLHKVQTPAVNKGKVGGDHHLLRFHRSPVKIRRGAVQLPDGGFFINTQPLGSPTQKFQWVKLRHIRIFHGCIGF